MATATFDVNACRKHFPALSHEQIYFENAGGSQILKEVVDSQVPKSLEQTPPMAC